MTTPNNTEVPDDFAKWACSFSGCDGGNLKADTWLCGIEWGGGWKNYRELEDEIKAGATPIDPVYHWKNQVIDEKFRA